MFFFSAVLIFCAFFVPFKARHNSYAATGVSIDELTFKGNGSGGENGKVFNQAQLTKLYSAILGGTGKTYNDLKDALTGQATYNGAGNVNKMLTATDIANNNSGGMVTVKFGGYVWRVVCVTTSDSGKIIATLQMDSTVSGQLETSAFATTNITATESGTYAGGVYGTSLIRTRILNNGGKDVTGYAAYNPVNKSSSHKYAKFTMPEVSGSLTNWIVKPSDVKYQAQQSWSQIKPLSSNYAYHCPNDAYGTPYAGTWTNGMTIHTRGDYNVWKDDYLWIPSLTEIGSSGGTVVTCSGIWALINSYNTYGSSIWTRSAGNGGNYGVINSVSAIGNLENGLNTTDVSGVTPALHLNLTQAESDSGVVIPTENTSSFTYTGNEQTYQPLKFDTKAMTISGNKQTNANEDGYTVTVTLNSGLKWTDGKTEAKEFKWIIKKADPIIPNKDNPTMKNPWSGGTPYVSAGLPELVNTGGTEGTFSWGSQKAKEGTNEYEWTFTPKEQTNYNTVTGKVSYTYLALEINGITAAFDSKGKTIYDNATYESLRQYITVTATYSDNTTLAITDYTVPNGTITSGDNVTFTVRSNKKSATVTVPKVEKAAVTKIEVEYDNSEFTYSEDLTYDAFLAHITVYADWNYGDGIELTADEKKSLVLSGEITAVNPEITVTYGEVSNKFNPIINKATFDMSGITLSDANAVYGEEYTLSFSAELPEWIVCKYLYDGSETKPEDAGEYTVTVSFTHSNLNYNAITDTKKATLTIAQANYPDANKIAFENFTFTFGAEIKVEATNVPVGVTAKYLYDGSETVPEAVGTYSVTAKFTHDNPNYKEIPSMSATLTITDKTTYNKKELTVTGEGITVNDKNLTATYKGSAFVVTPSGKVKDKDGNEVTSAYTTLVTVKQDGKEVTEIKDVGNYEVIIKYTMPTDGAYADYEESFEVPYHLTVNAADFNLADLTFDDKKVTYDGKPHSIEITGTVPEWLTVTYEGNGKTDADTYTVTASFSHENANYNKITETLTATLTIEQADYPDANKIAFENVTVTFGGVINVAATGIPEGVTVTYLYENEDKSYSSATPPTAVGKYSVTAKFTHGNKNYKDIEDKTITLTITDKTLYNKESLTLAGDGITVNDKTLTATYKGSAFTVAAAGKVKDKDGNDVTSEYTTTVTLKQNGKEVTEILDAGTYEVIVTYTMPTAGAYADYEESFEVKYDLTVNKADFVLADNGITFEDKSVEYNGTAQSIELAGEIPDWLTVTYEGNGTEPNTYTVTAKFEHSNPNYNDIEKATSTLTITKAKVSVPKYTGNLTYTGVGIVPKSSDFESFDANVMKLEPTSGTNAGENYKAKFTLLDTDHYEWADGTNETSWTISKAKLGATKTAGRLPEFTSDSYKGGIDGVVKYKYYTDATCTEEVHPDDLVAGTEYYVKAELSDSTNFEFAESAFTFSEVGFEHTIGEATAESGSSSKIWIWIVIGVGGALLLLTLIIVLSRRRAHAGYDDEYDQDYDYDDEEEDEDEDDEEYDDEDE